MSADAGLATMRTMGVTVRIEGDEVVCRTSGIDTALCLARELRLPLATITAVRLLSVREAKESLSWRVGGAYFPGLLATGWFCWKDRRHARQWWRVYRDPEVLVIDTDLAKPARLVLQLPERAELARALGERISSDRQ